MSKTPQQRSAPPKGSYQPRSKDVLKSSETTIKSAKQKLRQAATRNSAAALEVRLQNVTDIRAPLTEGMIRKGGINSAPDFRRPPPPDPVYKGLIVVRGSAKPTQKDDVSHNIGSPAKRHSKRPFKPSDE